MNMEPAFFFGIALILLGCSIFRFGQEVRIKLRRSQPCPFVRRRSIFRSRRYGLSAPPPARVQNWPLSVDFSLGFTRRLGCRLPAGPNLDSDLRPGAFHGKAGEVKSAAFS